MFSNMDQRERACKKPTVMLLELEAILTLSGEDIDEGAHNRLYQSKYL